MLGDVQLKHREELERLTAKLEQDKADSLDMLQTSMAAEKQVLFNDALKKVTFQILCLWSQYYT